MKKSEVVKKSHQLLTALTNSNDIIIDATLGNGFDSLFLSDKVSKVYAFDIQQEAINKASETLDKIGNVELILDSHINYQKYVSKYDGVIFNLGYLPGGNKQITTTAKLTITALNLMINDKCARFILLVVYPGHDEGMTESIEINQYLKRIDSYEVNHYYISEHSKKAYLILLQIKKTK